MQSISTSPAPTNSNTDPGCRPSPRHIFRQPQLNYPPYIKLDGDDRSGNTTGGGNLHVNLAYLSEFKRILIFAYIYDGTPNWSAADGVVTLYPPTGPEVEVRLDSHNNRARTCAIALLKNEKNELTVTREVRYINGTQSESSKAY